MRIITYFSQIMALAINATVKKPNVINIIANVLIKVAIVLIVIVLIATTKSQNQSQQINIKQKKSQKTRKKSQYHVHAQKVVAIKIIVNVLKTN